MPRTASPTIGQKIRVARKGLGWTQDELARSLDVKEGTVGRWERDEVNPPRKRLQEIALTLRLSPDELGVPPRVDAEPRPPAAQPEWAARLETKLDALLEFHRTGDRRALERQ